jgi:hypothetical protein
MATTTTTTYHRVARIEFDYHPDSSDPSFSFLLLRIYSPGSNISHHKISLFASDATSADHLHNIFLASSLMMDPPGVADKPPQSEEESA